MTLIVDLLSWLCFLVGGFFLLVGSLGMIRLQDFWARLHAASVIDSAGLGLLLAGMILQAGPGFVAIKLVLIILFLFITGPTATHAVANAAFVSGSRPTDLIEDVSQPQKEESKPKRKTPSKTKSQQSSRKRRKGA